MDKYVNVNYILAKISSHAQRIGTNNDMYQLAHLHIIELIEKEAKEIDEISIYGYPVSQLALVAARLRKEGKDTFTVKADNEAFLDGYAAARTEILSQIEQSLNKTIGECKEWKES